MEKKIGISQIGISIPKYFLKLRELAKLRKIPPSFAEVGLGVREARIPYKISGDNLISHALKKIKFKDVERFYFATETDPDASKPLIVKVLNKKFGLKVVPFQCKFACLGGILALILACEYVKTHTRKPAIVLTFDRSIYHQKDSKAELTQGCAAVALRIEENPKILAIDYKNFGEYAEDIEDFKVPYDSFPFPKVNGELTKVAYLYCQNKALQDWKEKNRKLLKKKNLLDYFDLFVLHTPFPKIVEWAAASFWLKEKLNQKELAKLESYLKNPRLFSKHKKDLEKVRKTGEFREFFNQKFLPALKYNPYIGNAYTSSIFISLASALENAKKGQRIGILGYGSGAASIFLQGLVTLNGKFESGLSQELKKGKKLTIFRYQKWRREK
jgi:hydroxymethylglutaryl-CoA synthase